MRLPTILALAMLLAVCPRTSVWAQDDDDSEYDAPSDEQGAPPQPFGDDSGPPARPGVNIIADNSGYCSGQVARLSLAAKPSRTEGGTLMMVKSTRTSASPVMPSAGIGVMMPGISRSSEPLQAGQSIRIPK